MRSFNTQTWLYYSSLFLLVLVSFCFYAPCFYPLYNSDHAIHTLMSIDFTPQRDIFYWGQNRLGSLLPLLTYPFVKLFSIHPLIAISVVQYVILTFSCLLVSKFIQNKWLVFVLFFSVFFPVNDYRAILYVGHPYSQQLFCAAIFIFFCDLFYKTLLTHSMLIYKTHIKLFFYLTAALLFYGLGIWVSEFGAILILIPALYLLLNIRTVSGKVGYKFICIYGAWVLSLIGIFLITLLNLKRQATADPEYDNAFFFSDDSIVRQFNYMRATIGDALFFRDSYFIDNLFYWIMIPLIIILLFLKNKPARVDDLSSISRSVIITCIMASVFLFFSTWNLRSHFCTRYFIPVYYMLLLLFLLYAGKRIGQGSIRLFAVVFMVYSSFYSFRFLDNIKGPGAMERFSEFSSLPKGTLIAGYWDAYLVGSVAYENLTVLSFEDQLLRNKFARKKALENINFYIIKNEEDIKTHSRNDTLYQFGHGFLFSGKKYDCNGMEVLQYFKVR